VEHAINQGKAAERKRLKSGTRCTNDFAMFNAMPAIEKREIPNNVMSAIKQYVLPIKLRMLSDHRR